MNRIALVLGLASATLTSPVAAPAASAPDEPFSEDVFGVDPVEYGSTFASNCYCSFCTKYCTVDGVTYKNGLCC